VGIPDHATCCSQSVDMLSPQLIRNCGDDLLVGRNWRAELSKNEGWSMPPDCSLEWWSKLSTIVPTVFLSAGSQEMFRDHVLEFADKLRKIEKGLGITIDVGEKEAHDHILVDFMLADMLRNQREGRSSRVLMKWTADTLAVTSDTSRRSLL
jgi:acetyl esterase/lipase